MILGFLDVPGHVVCLSYEVVEICEECFACKDDVYKSIVRQSLLGIFLLEEVLLLAVLIVLYIMVSEAE